MTVNFFKTTQIVSLCAAITLSSCSDKEDPKVPVLFETLQEVKAGAFDEVTVSISGFNPATHVLRINGKSLDVVQGAGNNLTFQVPYQLGSGKIEVKDGTATITGPDFVYEKTFVGFTSVDLIGMSMGGTKSTNSIVTYDPLNKAFHQATYSDVAFNSGDPRVTLNASTYNTTIPNTTLATWKVGQTLGLAVNPDGGIYFAQLYRKTASQTSTDVHTPILFYAPPATASSSIIEDATAQYDEVIDMEVNASHELYTIEKGKPYIRKNTRTVVSVFAGSATAGLQDGTGAAAKFTSINAITIDNVGNLYVADGSAVRKVTPDGVVTTLAGSSEQGDVDGTATQARFKKLVGIFWRSDGTLYLADSGNDVIKTLKDGKVTSLRKTSGAIDATAITMPMYVDSGGVIFTMFGGKYNPLIVFVPEEELSKEILELASMTNGYFSTDFQY